MRETREWLAIRQPTHNRRLEGKQARRRWSAIGSENTTLVRITHCRLYGADSVHEVLVCLTGTGLLDFPVGFSTRVGASTETAPRVETFSHFS